MMKREIKRSLDVIRDRLQQVTYWKPGMLLTPEQANLNIKILAESIEALATSLEVLACENVSSSAQPASGWSPCQIIWDGAKFALQLSNGGVAQLAGLSQIADVLSKGTDAEA